jgi:FSR family fosmidomycin resistance protein-like MFS transporter
VAARSEIDPAVYRLAGAHFVSDAYSNLYAPLLPALIPRLGLSLAAAGTLAMLFQLSASVSQLGFGHVADRWRPRLLMVAGPIVSVAVLSLIGVAWSPLTLGVILVAGGLGGAAFHPTAATLVHRLGGRRRGLAMSIHITGGSLGYSLAPVLFAPFVGSFGLSWTPLLAIPGLALLASILSGAPHVRPFAAGPGGGFAALRPYAKPLTLLYLIVVVRTMTSLSLATFVPVLLTRQGWTVGMAGVAVSIYLFAASMGGFTGGPLADRFGSKHVIAGSMIIAVPLLVAATRTGGWSLVIMLTAGGFLLQSTLPVNVTFAHQIAPVSAATVSSLMMGFAWGTGGLTAPIVGSMADRFGIEPTLTVIAFLPLLAALCSVPLPGGLPHETAGRVDGGDDPPPGM